MGRTAKDFEAAECCHESQIARSNMSKKALRPIDLLEQQLRKHFPKANVTFDTAELAGGTSYLDVELDGHLVVIQWRENGSFGVSSSNEHGYGEGADEVYQDLDAAYGRAVSLLLARSHTCPPESVRLSELRRERGISQVELAKLLNKQQGEISKLERRTDVKLSTVRQAVEKLGGTMKIIVTFPDGMERALTFEDDVRS
jgi:Helix-turn-helix domain